ncbi:MAG: diguanylate cyclase [Acidobacteria bacterium]|nr:diguanylate cyclase [Acidobacteriota bacterium]
MAGEADVPQSEQPAGKGVPAAAKYRVLFVEDDRVDQMAFERLVEKERLPYEYAIAASVSEALKHLRAARFDVVVTDFSLGDGTAFDHLPFARGAAVIVVTAAGNEEVAVQALREGASDYLTKDADRNYLRVLPTTIETAVRRRRIEDRSQMLSQALESIHDGVYITDEANRIVYANDSLCRMCGYVPAALLGQDAKILGESQTEGELFCRRSDGTRFPALLSRSAAGPARGGVVHVVHDITQQKRAEEELRQANQALRRSVSELESRNRDSALLSEMGEMLQTCQTIEEACAVAAHSAQRLFPALTGALYLASDTGGGFERAAEWGESPSGPRGLAPEQCWALRRGRPHVSDTRSPGPRCQHLDEAPEGWHICVLLAASGERLSIIHLQTGAGTPLPGAKQRVLETVGEHLALAVANLRLREHLRGQSIRDPLTGLFNRRYLEEGLTRELLGASREEHPLSVVMLDIDHFKRVNDVFGHDAGDAVLCQLAAFLQQQVRKGDFVCRYGGEEIVLVFPGSPSQNTADMAEKLRAGIRALRMEHRGQDLGAITVSLGVAGFPDHGATAEALVRSADTALYQAKTQGRDRAVVCVPAPGLRPWAEVPHLCSLKVTQTE